MFYYRTWKMVAKVIEFPPEIKKSSRELYGLINYGELWKKIHGNALDEKNGLRLNDLVMTCLLYTSPSPRD